MIRYVLGFIFAADDPNRVLLLRKTHGPGEMAGKLNGVGGQIRPGEAPVDAMARECREETGLDISLWHRRGEFAGHDEAAPVWHVTVFSTHASDIYKARAVTDELPVVVALHDPVVDRDGQWRALAAATGSAIFAPPMSNLSWLLGIIRDPASPEFFAIYRV